jgi:HK97 family phage major capsid protein
MSGQLWSVSGDGGYLYSDQLSEIFRMTLQPATKFRQLCDAADATDQGLHRGATFRWNVGSNLSTQGRRLAETTPIPQTQGSITQKSLTVYEYGNSVPYTAKLDLLAKQDVVAWIDQMLKDDARKAFDIEAFLQFKNTLLRCNATSGTSTTAITLDTPAPARRPTTSSSAPAT